MPATIALSVSRPSCGPPSSYLLIITHALLLVLGSLFHLSRAVIIVPRVIPLLPLYLRSPDVPVHLLRAALTAMLNTLGIFRPKLTMSGDVARLSLDAADITADRRVAAVAVQTRTSPAILTCPNVRQAHRVLGL